MYWCFAVLSVVPFVLIFKVKLKESTGAIFYLYSQQNISPRFRFNTCRVFFFKQLKVSLAPLPSNYPFSL